jgi:hypothetical protein
MTLDDFLSRFVEGYLFEDLRSMAAIRLPEGVLYGAAGYPMVMTALSGVELLGMLTASFLRHQSSSSGMHQHCTPA